jgi:hypothetical protein
MVTAAQDNQKNISKKAVKHFDKALEAFRIGDLDLTEDYISKALKEDSMYTDPWILLGDLNYERGRLNESAVAYRKALQFKPRTPEIVRQLLAQTLFKAENYREAVREYDTILEVDNIRPDLKTRLEASRQIAAFRQHLMDNPVEYHPQNLGSGINSPNDEYINVLVTEADRIVFTRKVPVSENHLKKRFEEDFFQAFLKDTGWSIAERFSFTPSAVGDAGGLCISADGRTIFYTACFRADSKGSCDIYYSEKLGDNWTEPKNLGEVINSNNWDAQPSLSPDGNTLYFASNREGGLGSSDIWKTSRLADGKWSKPVNLGASVNTAKAEMAPFIHFDNRSLYFSSDGHPGMGRHDLFLSKRDESGWRNPVNIGYPINTIEDELVMVISPDAAKAFISAKLEDGYGGYDIYSFPLPKEISPGPVTYMKGRVFDVETNEPLKAYFELIDLAYDSLIMSSTSSKTDGSFLVCLPMGIDYALNVSCPGYLFYSDRFQLLEIHKQADPFILSIPLQPISIGKSIVLKNIFYDTDKYQLRNESITELKKLVEFLNLNPGVSVEISGHTDSVGTAGYNLELSDKRAHSVYVYLSGEGISKKRLTYRGYGFSNPVDTNETEEGRAANRRTELRIIKID